MKRIVGVVLTSILLCLSCIDDFDNSKPSQGNLEFSRDTVFLDTVFTNISSSTRTLKVYNRSNQDITIPAISLGRGESSFYRLNVDGLHGKSFQNIDLLAKDSLYIFIEATIDFSKVTNPIYTDSIIFHSEVRLQDVDLVTLVQDAHFLYPQKNSEGFKEKISIGIDDLGEPIEVDGFYLDESQTWYNDKPYVIYGYAGVKGGNSLEIEEGVAVYFHQNSGLIVDKNASLKINGTPDKKVRLQGDRLEFDYRNKPGQWSTIWLRAGSKDNLINHAVIKNNDIGIVVDSISKINKATLQLSNTEIYNTSSVGLLARGTNLQAQNIVIANNGQNSLACLYGGNYDVKHSTLANYWSKSVRQAPTLLLSNYLRLNDEVLIVNDLENANFTNCIIDGGQSLEFKLEALAEAAFSFNFKNNLIKFDDVNGVYKDDPLYDFSNTAYYLDNVMNEDPDFKSVSSNELIIGQNSAAINKADKSTALEVPLDLLTKDRTQHPDIGAYQHIVIEN